jgi:hypothetical protein
MRDSPRKVHLPAPSIEHGHVVSASNSVAHLVRADKARAAENEDSKGARLPAWTRTGSISDAALGSRTIETTQARQQRTRREERLADEQTAIHRHVPGWVTGRAWDRTGVQDRIEITNLSRTSGGGYRDST